MIVIDTNNIVVGTSDKIIQDPETGIITCYNPDGTWHAIADDDRLDHIIYDVSVPDINKMWSYIDGTFTDITVTGTQSNNI
jgi:hypothetical protein